MIDNLQAVQFDTIRAQINMQSRSNKDDLTDLSYNISSMVQGGTVKSEEETFNDALFQFITSASSIRNSTLASFAGSSAVESTTNNLYYVMTNGLDGLRIGSTKE